jgi:hypothetical protein
MTRKKFRKYKKQIIESKTTLKIELERPEWADPDKAEVSQETWRRDFLAQFPWRNARKEVY